MATYDIEADGYPMDLPSGYEAMLEKLGPIKPGGFVTYVAGPPGWRPSAFYQMWQDAQKRDESGWVVVPFEMSASLAELAQPYLKESDDDKTGR